jgi:hypothetical protein
MDKQKQKVVEASTKLTETIEAAKPQTVEEWEEAYNKLLKKYARLHEAAARVDAVSLAPGICRPTWKGEDATHRQIVATNALDMLHAALWND